MWKFDYKITAAIDRTGVIRWKYNTTKTEKSKWMLFTGLVNKHSPREHKGRSTHLTGSHYHTNAVWCTTGVLRWYMVLYWHHTAHKQQIMCIYYWTEHQLQALILRYFIFICNIKGCDRMCDIYIYKKIMLIDVNETVSLVKNRLMS